MDRRDAIKSAILSAANLSDGTASATVVDASVAEGGRLIGVIQLELPLSASVLAAIKDRVDEEAKSLGVQIIVVPHGMRLSFYRDGSEAYAVAPVS